MQKDIFHSFGYLLSFERKFEALGAQVVARLSLPIQLSIWLSVLFDALFLVALQCIWAILRQNTEF
jgi:hypothetical protein